jgi:hypothetical protein
MIDCGLTTARRARASRAADAERSEVRRKRVCMERVLGICGVFFKKRDPKALAAWYREHLGVPVEPEHTCAAFTSAAAGEQAVWSAFAADTSCFGSGAAPLTVNDRLRSI